MKKSINSEKKAEKEQKDHEYISECLMIMIYMNHPRTYEIRDILKPNNPGYLSRPDQRELK